jgi:hypothetical protein
LQSLSLPGEGSADGDHEYRLRVLGDPAVAGEDEGAVHDQHGVSMAVRDAGWTQG